MMKPFQLGHHSQEGYVAYGGGDRIDADAYQVFLVWYSGGIRGLHIDRNTDTIGSGRHWWIDRGRGVTEIDGSQA